MITNLHHVGEGRNRITLKDGTRFAAEVRGNDRSGRVLLIERDEGFFDVVPYAEIDHASRPLNQGA